MTIAPTKTKFTYNPISGFFDRVIQDAQQTVIVAKSGGQYTTIQAAIDAITDASSTKIYAIIVHPGVYVESLTLKPFVYVTSADAINTSVVIQGKITASFGAAENTWLRLITVRYTAASDGDSAISVVGGIILDKVNATISSTNDYAITAVDINSTTVGSVLSECGIAAISTYNGSSKTLLGVRVQGTQSFSAIRNSIGISAAASSGAHEGLLIETTGCLLYNNNEIRIVNTKSGFSGSFCGTKVTTASTEPRICTNNFVSIIGTGNTGTANGYCLDSNGNSANIEHINPYIYITGFAPGSENASNTDVGDNQKLSQASTNKNLVKAGTGLSSITPFDLGQSGFIAWNGSGAYFSYDVGAGEFTLLRNCIGMVKGTQVWIAAGQTCTCTNFQNNFIYADPTGDLLVTTDPGFADKILLFSLYSDGVTYSTTKQTHPVSFSSDVSDFVHNALGSTLKNNSNAVVSILSGAGRTVQLVGASTYYDHGLNTTIADSTGVAISMYMMYTGASGATFRTGGKFTAIPAVRQSSTAVGDPNDTSLVTISNGKFVNFRLGVYPASNADDTAANTVAQFVLVPDTIEHNSSSAAAAQITANTHRAFPTVAVGGLEVINLGSLTIQGNTNPANATLIEVRPGKQVFGVNFASGSTSSAGSVTTDITAFDGELSGTDTSVQIALDRLDSYDSLLDWVASTATYRVGNVVRVTATGFIGEWRCVTAHTAAAAFSTDVEAGYWEVVANSEGSRELVTQALHGFTSGDVLYSNAGTYTKAKADAAATSEVVGIVVGATTNKFVLAKTGKITKSGWGLTIGATYYLSAATAGLITATEPLFPNYSIRLGVAISATELQVNIARKIISTSYSSLNALVTAIGSTKYTIIIPTELTVTADVTVPSNITLEFGRGGFLSAASSKTVTLNCYIDAGDWKIFGSNILINGSPLNMEMSIAWWGTTGDNSTDDATAFSSAFTALNAMTVLRIPTLRIPTGLYRLNSTPTPLTKSVHIKGSNYNTILKPSASVYAIHIVDVQCAIENIYFYGFGTKTGTGVYIDQQTVNLSPTVTNCRFGNLKYGVYVYGLVTSQVAHQGSILTNLEMKTCEYGIYLATRAEYVNISACDINGCDWGIYDVAGNAHITGCNLSDNVIGIELAVGGNDAHGGVTGCVINHCSSYGVKAGELNTKTHRFIGCDIIASDLLFTSTRGVLFQGCNLSSSDFYFDGSDGVTFKDCVVDNPLSTHINNNYNSHASYTNWVGCRDLDGKTVEGYSQTNGGIVYFTPSTSQTVANNATADIQFTVSSQATPFNVSQTKYTLTSGSPLALFENCGLGNGWLAINLNIRIADNTSVTDWTKVWGTLFVASRIIAYIPCSLIKTADNTYPFLIWSGVVRTSAGEDVKITLNNYTGQTLTLNGNGGAECIVEGL